MRAAVGHTEQHPPVGEDLAQVLDVGIGRAAVEHGAETVGHRESSMASTGCAPVLLASSPTVRPSASGIDALRTTTISGMGAVTDDGRSVRSAARRRIGELGQAFGHRADGGFAPRTRVVVQVPSSNVNV